MKNASLLKLHFRLGAAVALVSMIAGIGSPLSLSADTPQWWDTRGVIDQNAEESNYSPAVLGQAKWMAYQALQALQALEDVLPAVAAQIDADLTQGGNPLLANGWNPPSDPNENLRPLQIGQLKALAHPFYLRIAEAVGDSWMNEHLLSVGLPSSAGDPSVLDAAYLAADGHYYPWTTEDTPENKAVVNLGQLKLCFALPITEDSENPADGIADLWEYAVVFASKAQGGGWADIGQIQSWNAGQAGNESGTGPPLLQSTLMVMGIRMQLSWRLRTRIPIPLPAIRNQL